MKAILTVMLTGLLILSLFPVFAQEVRAQGSFNQFEKEDCVVQSFYQKGFLPSSNVTVGVNEEVTLGFWVIPKVEALNASINISLPVFLQCLSGSLTWRGNFQSAVTVQLSFTVKARCEFRHCIKASINSFINDRAFEESCYMSIGTFHPGNVSFPLQSRASTEQMNHTRSSTGYITVVGQWCFVTGSGLWYPMRRVNVKLLDEDPGDVYRVLETKATDDNGNYYFYVRNDDPIDGGGLDLCVEVASENSAAVTKVGSNPTCLYYAYTDTRSNVPDGSVVDFGARAAVANNYAWLAIDAVLGEYLWIYDRVSWSRSQVTILWPSGTWPGSSGDEIYLPAQPYWHDNLPYWWDYLVVFHEYAHSVMYTAYGNSFPYVPLPGPPEHNPWTEFSGGFALIEGWAEFMPCAIENNVNNLDFWDYSVFPWRHGNIESNDCYNWEDSGDMDGNEVEGSVASVLWDILDPTNDDSQEWGFSYIWSIILNDNPDDIVDFFGHWFSLWDNTQTIFGNKPSFEAMYTQNGVYIEHSTPSVTVSHSPQNPTDADSVYLHISASDSETGLHFVIVYWYDTEWHSTSMLLSRAANFLTSISLGSFDLGSFHYFAWAYDHAGNYGSDPTSGYKTFQVSDDDTTPPSLYNPVSSGDVFDSFGDYLLQISASDSSGIHAVSFAYRFGSGSWSDWRSAYALPGDIYWYFIPRNEWVLNVPSTIYFKVYAEDADNDRPGDTTYTYSPTYFAGNIRDDDTTPPSLSNPTSSGSIYDVYGGGYLLQISASDSSGISSVSFSYRFGTGLWSSWKSYQWWLEDDYWYYIERSEWITHVGETVYWQAYAYDNDLDRTGDSLGSSSGGQTGGIISDDDTVGPSYPFTYISEYLGDGDAVIEDDEQIIFRFLVTDSSGISSLSCDLDGIIVTYYIDGDGYVAIAAQQAPGGHVFRRVATDNDNDRPNDGAMSERSTSFGVEDDDTVGPTFSNSMSTFIKVPRIFRLQTDVADPSGLYTVRFRYSLAGGSWSDWHDFAGSSGETYWYDISFSVWGPYAEQSVEWQTYAEDYDNDGSVGDQASSQSSIHSGTLPSSNIVLYVPTDTTTIQGAADAALSGDIVYVYAGTYYENLVIYTTISLVGENADTTIIDGNGGDVITVYAERVRIANFTIRDGNNGIYVYSSGNQIEGNNIRNNWLYGVIFFSSNNSVIGNNITANDTGIGFFYGSDSNLVSGNNITANSWGIWVTSSSNNIVFGNDITSNSWWGIQLCESSNYNSVGLNNVANNMNGILLYSSSYNSLTENNITANSHDGIRFYDFSNYNSIIGNNVENNGVGIRFDGSARASSNNIVHHNNFIGNSQQVFCDESANAWDDGYPSGGNYWSDYAGLDLYWGSYQNKTGSDGVGDAPYVVDGSNRDNYPLMSPFEYWSNSIPGDINKDTEVDEEDLSQLAATYGFTAESLDWNPNCDIEEDDRIDVHDLFLLGKNYGEGVPPTYTLFADGFESYTIDAFPSAGDWVLVYNGMGTQYQIVTDVEKHSGEKSLQLWGQSWWSARAWKGFETTANIIGYEEAIMISERNPYPDGTQFEHTGFFNKDIQSWGRSWAQVRFYHSDLTIRSEGDPATILGTWTPGTWYKVKVILDRTTNTYSVWINGQLRGSDLTLEYQDTDQINGIGLTSEHPGVKVYHDDVRVFSEYTPVTAIGIGVYWDNAYTNQVSSVNWGVMDPGSSKTVTIYVKNEGNVPVTLLKTTANWNPPEAANFATLNWNYTGQSLEPSQAIPITLTLYVSPYAQGFTMFSSDAIITATGSGSMSVTIPMFAELTVP